MATFAVDTFLLGDITSLNAAPSTSAWESIGYDLDGLSTTSDSVNVCDGDPKARIDGNYGIDNAFGAIFIPILQTASARVTPSVDETNFIESGQTTIVLRVGGLSDDLTQTVTGLTADVATGSALGAPPAFDTTTTWPTITGSQVHFREVYANDGVIVARNTEDAIQFALLFVAFSPPNEVALPLAIHNAVVSFRRTTTSRVVDGTIAGTLDTTELIDAMKQIAGRISPSLCGSAFDGIADQLRSIQDILLDGTNRAGVACNAISIGLKFTARKIADDSSTVDVPAPPDACADAGTD